MTITNIKISLDGGQNSNGDKDGDKRPLAFCTIVFDQCFVIDGLRIMPGKGGVPFVAMSSKKRTDHCPKCQTKNHLRAKYCNECGRRLGDGRGSIDRSTGKPKHHTDTAYPITRAFRGYMEAEIMRRYHEACGRAQALDRSFGEGILTEP